MTAATVGAPAMATGTVSASAGVNAAGGSGVAVEAADPSAVLDERAVAGYARGLGAFCLFWLATAAVAVFPLMHRYRHPVRPVVAWVVTLVLMAVVVGRAVRRPLTRAEGLAVVGITIGAEIVVGRECPGYNVTGFANWPSLAAPGLLGLVAGSRPAWEWAAGAALLGAVIAAEVVDEVGWAPLGLSRFAAATWALWAFLMLVSLGGRMLRATNAAGARAAEEEIALDAARSASEAVIADRQIRLRVLEERTLSLVRGLAEGLLDPLDPEVRQRCRTEATSLRRMLNGSRSPTAALVGIPEAVEGAERRGASVRVQAIGELTHVPPAALKQLAAPIVTALEDLTEGLILLTVIAVPGNASVTACFPAPTDPLWPAGPWPAAARPDADPPSAIPLRDAAAGPLVDVLIEVTDGKACVRATWPREERDLT